MGNGNGNTAGKLGWPDVFAFLRTPYALFAVLGLAIFIVIVIVIFRSGESLLGSLQSPDIARGLITFLVVFITVSIALILAIYVIASSSVQDLKERFGFGKEILSLLIGVLGTILGFYFGAATQTTPKDIQKSEQTTSQALSISPVFLSSDKIDAGGDFNIAAHITGGKPPYTYSISFNPVNIVSAISDKTSQNGIINEILKAPESLEKDYELTVKITAKDSTGSAKTYDDKSRRVFLKKK